MHLIDDRHLLSTQLDDLEINDAIVGNSNTLRESFPLQLDHLLPRIERVSSNEAGRMNQVKINRFESELEKQGSH